MKPKLKERLDGQLGGICPVGLCNGGFGCQHNPAPDKEAEKEFFSKEKGELGRLGHYLNDMVSDLNIDHKGQYLRDLFGKYEDEVKKLLSQQKQEVVEEIIKNIERYTMPRDSDLMPEGLMKEGVLGYLKSKLVK